MVVVGHALEGIPDLAAVLLFEVRGVVDEDRFGDVVARWRHRLRDPVLSRPRWLEHGETIVGHDGRQDRSVIGVGLVDGVTVVEPELECRAG